jgi:hypothetical protein
MLAKLLVALPATGSASWDAAFTFLRQDRSKLTPPADSDPTFFRTLIPLFLRYWDKEMAILGEPKCQSLPRDLTGVFSSRFPGLPVARDDVMIVRSFLKYSTAPMPLDLLGWVTSALRSLLQDPQKANLSAVGEQLFLLIKNCKEFAPKLDLSDCCPIALNLAVHAPLQVPVEICVDSYPEAFLKAFSLSAAKAWSADHLAVIVKLLFDPQLPKFRAIALETVLTFLLQPSRFPMQLQMSVFFSACARAVNLSTEFDIAAIIGLCARVFSTLQAKSGGASFRPAILRGYFDVFLPLKFAEQFVTGNGILDTFLSQIVPLFMSNPAVFHHPVFVRRFFAFLQKLPVEVRDSILDSIAERPGETPEQRAFVFHVQCDRCRYFQPEGTVEISADFHSFPKCRIFQGMQLQLSALYIALETDTILTDVSECPTLLLTPLSQAAGIQGGVLDLSTAPTLNRAVQVIRFLGMQRTDDDNKMENSAILLGRAKQTPFVSRASGIAFRFFAQNNKLFDLGNRALVALQMAKATVSIMSRQLPPDKQVMNYIPYFFTLFRQTGLNQYADRAFELCLQVSKLTLADPSKENAAAAFFFHGAIGLITPFVTKEIHDLTCLLEIRRFLEAKREPNVRDQSADMRVLRFHLQLLPVIAAFVYEGALETVAFVVPFCLLARNIELIFQAKEMIGWFQKCVQAVSKSAGFDATALVVFELFRMLRPKSELVSPPRLSPFASVAKWLSELDSAQKEFQTVLQFLEAVKPMMESQFCQTVAFLERPIHRVVTDKLLELLEAFPDWSKFCSLHPNGRVMVIAQSSDLLSDCWRFDWHSIDVALHLEAFVRFSFPARAAKLIKFAGTKELSDFVAGFLPSLIENSGFSAFLRVYRELFPASTLSECFWAFPQFSEDLPLRGRPLSHNIQYLDARNFCDDSLGLLKLYSPSLSIPVALHQVGNYRAAKGLYLSAMSQNPLCYFCGLIGLRTVTINTTLPGTPELYPKVVFISPETNSPVINLPFSTTSTSANDIASAGRFLDLTTRFSSVYLPLLIRAALSTEVWQCLKLLHPRASRAIVSLPDLTRAWTGFWMRALDKQMALASAVAWRLLILEECQRTCDQICGGPTVQNPAELSEAIRDGIRRNRLMFSRLLMKSGATRASLRFLSTAANANANANSKDGRPFRIDPRNLPRVAEFLRGSFQTAQTVVRPNYLLALRDFALPPGATDREAFAKLWLPAVAALHRIAPAAFDPHPFFARVQAEIAMNRADRPAFYLALCLSIVKGCPAFSAEFSEAILLGSLKEELKQLFMRWLPHLLEAFAPLPLEFLTYLFKTQSTQFFLAVGHAKARGPALAAKLEYLDEILQQLRSKREFIRCFTEYEAAMHWVTDFDDDISKLDEVAHAHLDFYAKLAAGGFDDLDNAEFCASHRPVLTLSRPFSENLCLSGFRFPGLFGNVISIGVVSDGENEAKLRLTSTKGEPRLITLASPAIYRFSYAELLFMFSITRLIEGHQASRARSKFVTYPAFFLLTPKLLVVLTSPMTSPVCFAPKSLPQLFAARANSSFGQDESPASIRDRKSINIENSALFNSYAAAAEGSKVTFYYIRQSFASNLASSAVFRFFFRAALPILPAIGLFADHLRVCFPGFFRAEAGLPQLPTPPSFLRLLPRFVLGGSFSTTWWTIAEVMMNNHDKIRVFLSGLGVGEPEEVDEVIDRACKMANGMAEGGEKTDEPFHVLLLDHLISGAENSLLSQPFAFSWI